jgi:hypothetical protein
MRYVLALIIVMLGTAALAHPGHDCTMKNPDKECGKPHGGH